MGRRGLNVHICWELEIETYLQSLCTYTRPMCLTWNRKPFSLTISSQLPGLKPYWIWARSRLLQSSADKLEPARKGRDQERGKCAGKGWGKEKKRWKKRLDIMLNVWLFPLSPSLFTPPPPRVLFMIRVKLNYYRHKFNRTRWMDGRMDGWANGWIDGWMDFEGISWGYCFGDNALSDRHHDSHINVNFRFNWMER